jgi:uncharacterized membrane protein YgdD (TMEM256/DUF423 family)
MTQRTTLLTAAFIGVLTVILGASGAHALKPTLVELGKLDTYELANRYQFYHVLALLATGILMNFYNGKRLGYAALFFLLGIVLFSGSLYGLCFIKLKVLGPLTPIGGVFFILGWVFLAASVWKTGSRAK